LRSKKLRCLRSEKAFGWSHLISCCKAKLVKDDGKCRPALWFHLMSAIASSAVARVMPSRRAFGYTLIATFSALQLFLCSSIKCFFNVWSEVDFTLQLINVQFANVSRSLVGEVAALLP
jgi:hypothetical protein